MASKKVTMEAVVRYTEMVGEGEASLTEKESLKWFKSYLAGSSLKVVSIKVVPAKAKGGK